MDIAQQLSILKDKLLDRVPNADGVGCFLCRLILGDLAKNGSLTQGFPEICSDGKPNFPVEGKVAHLKLEGFWTEDLKALLPIKA